MKFDLARRARRNSRKPVVLPPIFTTQALADDLAILYLRVVNTWRDKTEAIVDSYDRTLGQLLQTDSVEETGGQIDEVAEAINRLVLELTPDLRRWAFRVEQWHRGKWARAVLSAVEVELSTLIGPEDVAETIEAVLRRNTSLIRDVGEQIRQRIADAVFRGFTARSPAREIAKEIREATSMGRARAIRIAADQTTKLSSALDAQRQRQAGLDHWKWRHSGKLHPRPEHVARDGKIYTDKTAPEDEPGELPYCGCVRQGVLVFAE